MKTKIISVYLLIMLALLFVYSGCAPEVPEPVMKPDESVTLRDPIVINSIS